LNVLIDAGLQARTAQPVPVAAAQAFASARPSRIGFLFNHDELHQVAHTAPIIGELLRGGFPGEIVVLASSAEQAARVCGLAGLGERDRLRFESIAPPAGVTAIERAIGRSLPLGRVAALVRHRALLDGFDALVAPETTSAFLRTHLGVMRPKLVYLPHGAGDRAVGFRPVTAVFDLVLIAGEKVRDRMLAAGLIRPDGHAIVGYPKFDSISKDLPEPVFSNGRPTVVYNPHFDPKLSSWYRMGADVLGWFAGHPDYNLIFAPHVMLHRRRVHLSVEHRRLGWVGDAAARFAGVPNIHIDTGSGRSLDMSYTRQGDIYLGDVSSQVYEFLTRPRPCIFLNSHRADWRASPDYAHWRLGDVLDSVGDLPSALQRAVAFPDTYRREQEAAVQQTFSLSETPSARRAAAAILAFLARPAV
jgi:hypothetical protein